jgi:hypothetical protein
MNTSKAASISPVVAKPNALLSEERLHPAMWEVGCFPANTPPRVTKAGN